MPKLFYDLKNFKIYQKGYDPLLSGKTESIFAQGNGYLGIRAVDEENSHFHKEDFFINGLFNRGDENEVSELANLSNTIQLKILIDGRVFETSHVSSYYKELDLKNGKLKRILRYKQKDKFFELIFERLVDQENKQLYAQKITIKQLKGLESEIKIFPLIDGQSTNRGIQHFKEGKKLLISDALIQYQEQTNQSNFWAIHNMKIKVFENKKLLECDNDNFVIKMARRQIGYEIKSKVSIGKDFVLEKIMSVNSLTKDVENNFDNFYQQSLENAKKIDKLTFDDFEKNSQKQFDKIYSQFDVQIEGNKSAQYDFLAMKFALYHMNIFVPNDPRLSVGAKGLSGEGYQGHCYWDTEFFVMPNYLFTNPKIARNLLEYRYLGINGARDKAKEKNLLGAQYPWEAALPEEGEVTPYWGQPNITTGEQVPIASREQEIHVPGDVAFAVNQYFEATNDQKFMNDMGYEMIFDTAMFWASRAECNNDICQITNVMGPNEYKGNIDNNNFINLIAKRNLELVLKHKKILESTSEARQILNSVLEKIPYPINWEKIEYVFEKMYLQKPNENLIIAENDQFLKLSRVDISEFQFLGDAGTKLFNTIEGNKKLNSQIVKQADVVLSMFIFKELFSKKIIEANLDFYLPVTTHDSSLSATTYTIVAIDLRKMDIAQKLFKYSIDIDLGTNFRSSDQGIHSGSLAAIWQTIVFGFGGFRFYNNQIHINPILAKGWTKLSYSVIVKNIKLKVNVYPKYFEIIKNGEDNLDIFVNGKEVTLDKVKNVFEVNFD